MPLLDVSLPLGSVPQEKKPTLITGLAEAVLDAMGLPASDFFRGATWVHLHEISPENSGTGSGAGEPHFTATVTALSGFLDAARNEALGARLSALILDAAGLDASKSALVWTIVQEIPEGSWAIGGGLTRRANIDAFIAEAEAQARVG